MCTTSQPVYYHNVFSFSHVSKAHSGTSLLHTTIINQKKILKNKYEKALKSNKKPAETGVGYLE